MDKLGYQLYRRAKDLGLSLEAAARLGTALGVRTAELLPLLLNQKAATDAVPDLGRDGTGVVVRPRSAQPSRGRWREFWTRRRRRQLERLGPPVLLGALLCAVFGAAWADSGVGRDRHARGLSTTERLERCRAQLETRGMGIESLHFQERSAGVYRYRATLSGAGHRLDTAGTCEIVSSGARLR